MSFPEPHIQTKTSLRQLHPTLQLLIMLAFTLALVGVIALAGFLLPQGLTGAVTAP